MADSGRQEITGRRSGRYLLNRLPRHADGGVDIGEIDLSHLRVEKIDEYNLSLSRGLRPAPGFGDGTGGAAEVEKSLLSELIEAFGAKFGTDFTEEDVRKRFNKTNEDPKARAAAVVNDEANFGKVFDRPSPTTWPTTSRRPPAQGVSTSVPTRASGATRTAALGGRRGG